MYYCRSSRNPDIFKDYLETLGVTNNKIYENESNINKLNISICHMKLLSQT